MRIWGLIALLILVAIGAYVTNPSLADHQKAADQWFADAQAQARADLRLGSIINLGVASVTQSGTYSNHYLFSRYVINAEGQPFLKCFGVFTRVSCKEVEAPAAAP